MSDERELGQLAKAAVEAMLFAAPQPLTLADMARASGMPESQVHSALRSLQEEYAKQERGILLQYVGQGYQLFSRPEFSTMIQELGRQRQVPALSRAALETLSVVAYRQPITRAEVESLRGVRSDGTLTTLSERGLIAEGGRKDTVGRPILYVTTQQFLVEFGLGDLEDLPPLPEDPGPDEA